MRPVRGLALVALAILVLLRTAPASAETASDIAPGRLIVKLRGERSSRFSQESYGALAVEARPELAAQIWRVSPGTEESVAARLRARSDVEYAEPDRIQRPASLPNDRYFESYQWNLPRINAPRAWDVTVGSASVVVAVIDTGLDLSHPDRPANLRLGCDYVQWRLAQRVGPCPSVSSDLHGHGTHVAGIVAARQNNELDISGVAPGVTVLVIRTGDTTGASYGSDVATAIREAVDAGARVINLSLGGPSSSLTQRSAINYALARGVVVVASSGNEYESGNLPSYPAAYPGVIAVGATTYEDQHAPYSSTGSHLSLVAPGGSGTGTTVAGWIVSLYPLALGRLGAVAGTSQAAPQVAGATALVLSARPSLSGSDVASVLRSTARRLGGSAPNPTYGYGMVDIYAAVAASDGRASSIPTPTVTPTPSPTRTATPSPTPLATPVTTRLAIPQPAAGAFRQLLPITTR